MLSLLMLPVSILNPTLQQVAFARQLPCSVDRDTTPKQY